MIIVLQGLPIAFLLFLVLPQLPPLWQMPTSKSSKTGLAETVTPGDIASLAQSSELAFTATFQNKEDIPVKKKRYWRAIVMESFDGKTWAIDDRRKLAERQLESLGKTPKSPSRPGTLTLSTCADSTRLSGETRSNCSLLAIDENFPRQLQRPWLPPWQSHLQLCRPCRKPLLANGHTRLNTSL